MAEKKKRLIELPETKGMFQLKGLVTGVSKDGFYKEQTTKTQKLMRFVNFGIQTSKDTTVYLNLNGMEKDKVYFSKKSEVKGQKPDVREVPWKDRFTYNAEGYTMMGTKLGLTKTTATDTGKQSNVVKVYDPFDACLEIQKHLSDDMNVFVGGNIEYSHLENDKGEITNLYTKFIPNQMYLTSKPVDFEADDFSEVCFFTQGFVFREIVQDEADKNKFIIHGTVIGYSTIEDITLFTYDKNYANIIRKGLKPYTFIEGNGMIAMIADAENVEESNNPLAGTKNAMKRIANPVRRELIMTGIEVEKIDDKTYTEQNIDEARKILADSKKADNDFNGKVGVPNELSGMNSKIAGHFDDDEMDKPW